MKKLALLFLALCGALAATADHYSYHYYIFPLIPYDFEEDGIYYRFGDYMYNKDVVSVTIGLKEPDYKTFD